MEKDLQMINTSSIRIEIHESQIIRTNIPASNYWVQRDVFDKCGCNPFQRQAYPIWPQRVCRKMFK